MRKKQFWLKMLVVVALAGVFAFLISEPIWAAKPKECGGVETALIECKETGSGAIGRIILDIIEILSIGVGILGVIGITVVGIQYMTAGGNEQKTTQAKRRILEIVIGLAAYAVLFGFVEWLGATPDESVITQSNGETLAEKAKAEQKKTKETTKKLTGKKKNETSNSKKVLASAQNLAEKMAKLGFKYHNPNHVNTWEEAVKKKRLNCAEYVSLVLQDAGLIKKGKVFWLGYGSIHKYSFKNNKNFKVSYKGGTIKSLVNKGKLVPGDIVGHSDGPHTMIYKGKKNGKYYFYSVNNYGSGVLTVNRVTKKTYPGSYKIFVIIHPK